MEKVSFEFDDISVDDVIQMEESSPIFNMSEKSISKAHIFLASFHDESLGDSVERLDVAVHAGDAWTVLDIQDKISGYNDIPLGYVIPTDVEYDMVMVILRRMSSVVLDSQKFGTSAYIYYKVSDKYGKIDSVPSLLGNLAKKRIRLDGSEEMHERLKREGLLEEIDKIIS